MVCTEGRRSEEIRVPSVYGGGLTPGVLSGKDWGWKTGVSCFTNVKLSLRVHKTTLRAARIVIKSRKQSVLHPLTWLFGFEK